MNQDLCQKIANLREQADILVFETFNGPPEEVDLASGIREVARRLHTLKDQYAKSAPNLKRCGCDRSVTSNFKTIPSREIDMLHHLICERCDGVAASYRPDLLKEKLLTRHQSDSPWPFFQFVVSDVSDDVCDDDCDPDVDDDGHHMYAMPTLELLGPSDVRVFIAPHTPTETAVSILQKVIDQLNAGAADKMSFVDCDLLAETDGGR